MSSKPDDGAASRLLQKLDASHCHKVSAFGDTVPTACPFREVSGDMNRSQMADKYFLRSISPFHANFQLAVRNMCSTTAMYLTGTVNCSQVTLSLS